MITVTRQLIVFIEPETKMSLKKASREGILPADCFIWAVKSPPDSIFWFRVRYLEAESPLGSGNLLHCRGQSRPSHENSRAGPELSLSNIKPDIWRPRFVKEFKKENDSFCRRISGSFFSRAEDDRCRNNLSVLSLSLHQWDVRRDAAHESFPLHLDQSGLSTDFPHISSHLRVSQSQSSDTVSMREYGEIHKINHLQNYKSII